MIRFFAVRFSLFTAALSLTLLGGNAWCETPQMRSTITVKRGLTAKLEFSHPSSTLRAVRDQSMDAAVLVRLERRANDQQESHYTLRFFGTVAGDYDLSRMVVERDGSVLSAGDSFPPMMVRIVSELPPGRGTNLYEIDDPILRAPSGYRAALVLFALLWVAAPMVWAVQRLRSRRPEPEVAISPTPTLADQMRPLVQRASQGELTIAEQSRLELMVYAFWQRRLELPESLIDALPIMRRHDKAGGLLRSLEAWIHNDAGSSVDADPDTIRAMLEPYQTCSIAEVDSTSDNAMEVTA